MQETQLKDMSYLLYGTTYKWYSYNYTQSSYLFRLVFFNLVYDDGMYEMGRGMVAWGVLQAYLVIYDRINTTVFMFVYIKDAPQI